MHHVLLVGADPSLLYTRSLVLGKTGASIKTAAPDQALLLLNTCAFDLLVLCHSTRDRDVHQLSLAARAHSIKTLLIEAPTGKYCAPADVDDRFLLEDGPALLITTVQHLLAMPCETTPPARLVPFVPSRRHDSHKPPPDTLAQP
jgi:CheY-like chemotaxis protein